MLLMVLPNKHLLTFSQYKDAKTLFKDIQARFGGNDTTNKTQKPLLKKMYKNFNALSTKSLDSIFNRLQKIVSQLAILGETISQEDLNMKFLRSLPAEWNTHVVVWRNKVDLDTMSIDVLYNNFKIVEQEVKRTVTSSSSLGSQNMAFLSSPGSTNEVDTANIQVSTVSTPLSTVSSHDNTANLSDAFLANQPNGSQLMHEYLEQIHKDEQEEMDLKWQLAMLSMRERRYFQRTGKKITINGSDTSSYDKTKVECFNCYKMGYFARKCRSPRNQESSPRNQDSLRRIVNVEDTSSKAMVAIDGAGFDCSYMADDEIPTNMDLMAFSDSEIKIDNFKNASRSLDKLIGSQISVNSRKGVGFASYNVVAPPPTGLFAPPTIDLSNSILEEFQYPEFEGYGPKASKNVYVDTSNEIKKALDVLIIKYWVSDCDEDGSEVMVLKSDNIQHKPEQANQPRKGDPQDALKDTWVFNSRCSRHMIGNKSCLIDSQKYNGGFVAFVGSSKGGKITGKGLKLKGSLINDGYANLVQHAAKSDENTEFHQIVDFLSSCSINYALTESPTIYASYIEQFWNTGSSKTINSVKQIHAIVGRNGYRYQSKAPRNHGREGIMEHTIELTNTLPPTPHDSPLTGGYTPGSDECRLTLLELMNICTTLSNKVTTLETKLSSIKAVYHKSFITLTKRVKKLEKQLKQKRSRAVIHSSDEEEPSLDIKDSPKQGRMIEELDKDEDVNLVSEQGEVKETTKPLKDDDDATLAETLPNIKRNKGDQTHKIDWNDPKVLRYYAFQNRPFAKAEVRKNMCMYLKNQGGYKQSYFKGMKYEDIRPILERVWDQIHTFVSKDSKIKKEVMKRSRFHLQQESLKKQKLNQQTKEEKEEVDSNQEVEEMKLYMRIVPNKEIAIDAIPLATKPLMIVAYKIVKERKISTYHIIRADGCTKRYTSMINLLKNINREDLETLWKLVKDKHRNTKPEEGYERVLWGDLKVMFESDIKSEALKQLQGYDVTVWKLFFSSGVHFVRFKNLHIFMLVDKIYPLTPATITKMLERKLQADQWNEMCYQLLKLMLKQQRKR
nr:hypothetical protein [Tanacetum cinerariifolium]